MKPPSRNSRNNFHRNAKKSKQAHTKPSFLNQLFIGDFSKKQGIAFGIVILLLLGVPGGIALAQGPLFHTANNGPYTNPNAPDPLKFLYANCIPSLSSWQVQLVTFVSNSGCGNNGNFGNILRMGENSTTPAIAIDQTTMDLSTASSKVLEHDMTFAVGGTLNFPTLDFYITSNKTLPVGAYDPFNDRSVVYLTKIEEPTSGGVPTSVFIHEYVQKDPAQAISQQAFDCPSGGTTGVTITCFTYGSPIPTAQLLEVTSRLNFTGRTDSLSNSNFAFQKCPTVPCTVLSSTVQTSLPIFPLTGNYYMGIYASAQSGPPNIDVYGSIDPPNINLYDLNNQNSMMFAIYAPNPVSVTPPTYIDSGGFFGPIIRALISIGVFMAQNIISFITFLSSFLAPFLAGVIAIFSAVFTVVFNALGSIFGDSSLGTQIGTFLSGLSTYLSNVFGNGIAVIGSIVTFLGNSLGIFSAFLSGSNTFISFWEGLASFWATIVGFASTVFGWLSHIWVSAVVLIAIVMTCNVAFGAISSLLDTDRNPFAWFPGIFLFGIYLLILNSNSTTINVLASNSTIYTNYSTAISQTQLLGTTSWFFTLIPFLLLIPIMGWMMDDTEAHRMGSSGEGLGHWMPNFTAWLHLNKLLTVDIIKGAYWFFREAYDIITKGIGAIKGRWSPVEVAGTG